MAFSGSYVCTSFKKELLEAVHDFRAAGDTFKIAMYTSSATLTASTTAYSATNEASGTNYTAGGTSLTNVAPTTSGTTAYADFGDPSWAASTITARGALVYNTTPTHTYTNPSVVVLDFGSDVSSSAGTFTIVMPTADATNAIVRIT